MSIPHLPFLVVRCGVLPSSEVVVGRGIFLWAWERPYLPILISSVSKATWASVWMRMA